LDFFRSLVRCVEMRFFRSFLFGFITLFCYLFFSPQPLTAIETGEYIAIRKQGSSKIALVLNKLGAKEIKDSSLVGDFNDVIRDGIDFTGLFSMISPPVNVNEYHDRDNMTINFDALNSVGSEVYAGGKVIEKSGIINLDMEVFEIAGAKPLLKKTYTGNQGQLRSIGHAFCADLVELLTGKKSVFGSKIVFVSNKTGYKEIYRCDFDGQGVEQLTNSKSISLTPALSPDGKYIAYTDFTLGHPTLSIKNLLSNRIVSTVKNGVSIDPAWRNSREVATTLSYEGEQKIYFIRPDGSVAKRVTKGTGIDLSPTFSPDGSKMAFVSDRNGLPQIFIQDIQSGEVQRLTFSGRYNTQPSWSPVGNKIAYTTWENGGEINIFTINADGSDLKQLTEKSGENEAPSWSPDGEMIVFSSNRQGKKKLYVMNSTGENQRGLLKMDGEQTQPNWSLFR